MIICLQCNKAMTMDSGPKTNATFVTDDIKYNAHCRMYACNGCGGRVLEKVGDFRLQKDGESDGEYLFEEREL